MPNRLTLLYSEIYYKKENYLKVKTVVFKYITLYSKGWVYWYISTSAYLYVPMFSHSYVLNSRHVSPMWLGYPLFYGFTGPISPAFRVLMLSWSNSLLTICTILFIRSVTLVEEVYYLPLAIIPLKKGGTPIPKFIIFIKPISS